MLADTKPARLAESTEERPRMPAGPSRAGYGPAPETELEFREILIALVRRRRILLGFALLGLFCGLVAGLVAKRRYSATATVEFAGTSTRALGLDDPSPDAGELSTLELLNTELKTQQAEITDEGTALAVIRAMHLETQKPYAIPGDLRGRDPLNRERGLPLEQAPHQRERVLKLFASHLSVELVKGTRLLNVTFTDSDPERAAAIANAVVSASIDQTSGRRSNAFSQVSSWLTDQLASLKQRVEDSQRRAEAYEGENQKDLAGMMVSANSAGQGTHGEGPMATESVPVSRLLSLNSDLTAAQVSRLAKEAIYRVAATGDPEAVLSIANSALVTAQGADSSLAPGNGGLALLQRLRTQQVELNVQMSAAATRYGAKSSVMLEYERQRAAIQRQMDEELARIRDRARSDLDLATRAEEGLRQQVTAQQSEVSQWSTKADHLLLLQGEAASNRALYQDLYAKLQESQFAAGMRASHVTVLDPARAPTTASSPKRSLDLALGLVTGLVLGLIAVFGVELMDTSLHSAEEVQKAFGVPVLGSIPRFPRGTRTQEAWVVAAPRSAVAEAYRRFRTALFAERAGDPGRVILFASARPAEGKATTCLNTAAALAVQGHRVLILNADMRRTEATKLLGTPSATGLSRCLAGGVPVAQALQQIAQFEDLFVLPAGPPPDNPAELLSSRRFQELLTELRREFDYILIDSPPALLFTDTRLLAGCADASVLVLEASHTPRVDLLRTMDELRGTGAAFLGVLFNRAEAKRPAYARFGYQA